MPRTAMQTLSIDPRRSMKAATAELETALESLGANLTAASRRRTALLASELIAQVAGRDLDQNAGPVDLTVRFAPNSIRLETRGPARPSIASGSEPTAGNGLAEWGRFVLDRLASRWGIDGADPSVLWAEVELASAEDNGR